MAGTPCLDCGLGPTVVSYKDPASKHCYLYNPGAQTWDAARAYCLAWNGDLAATSTVQEMTMITGSNAVARFAAGDGGARVWVGGNDAVTEGTFVWSNGEMWLPPPDGPSFGPGQPNGGTGANCITIDVTGTLHDRPCTEAHEPLCERVP